MTVASMHGRERERSTRPGSWRMAFIRSRRSTNPATRPKNECKMQEETENEFSFVSHTPVIYYPIMPFRYH